MTQAEKDLLLKDLCARLPYGVRFPMKIWNDKEGKIVEKIAELDIYNKFRYAVGTVINGPVKEYVGEIVKPYLFPMSSMTEEQEMEYDATFATIVYEDGRKDSVMTYKSFDWLNKNHFDYRGLIPMGLAIDATNLNIY